MNVDKLKSINEKLRKIINLFPVLYMVGVLLAYLIDCTDLIPYITFAFCAIWFVSLITAIICDIKAKRRDIVTIIYIVLAVLCAIMLITSVIALVLDIRIVVKLYEWPFQIEITPN